MNKPNRIALEDGRDDSADRVDGSPLKLVAQEPVNLRLLGERMSPNGGGMTAEAISNALGGRRVGRGWSARCPAHNDHTPSLSINEGNDGRVLVRCFAGCSQAAVIGQLRAIGLWPTVRRNPIGNRSKLFISKADGTDFTRTDRAMTIWRESEPLEGTIGETYFRSRRLVVPATRVLRFHPRLRHPAGELWPAVIAIVTRGSSEVAIHRTFLSRDGTGKAPVDPQKMMLGPCSGGAVRFSEAGDMLMIGEGIETCLAAMQETGHPTWAALSTSGLRALDLPQTVRDVIVLADGDDPGEAAARDCALRWKREGRRVRIARPPSGLDFNDLLLTDDILTAGEYA
jgi:putative DNA primase/helicase